jgi:hypothetical protein
MNLEHVVLAWLGKRFEDKDPSIIPYPESTSVMRHSSSQQKIDKEGNNQLNILFDYNYS